jgi:tetratricopeptide (TPR) repeat protein
MRYQGSSDQQISTRPVKNTIGLIVLALLFMASNTTFAQTPEIRKAFRYQDIEQPSKVIPALEQAVKASPENLYYLGVGYITAGNLDKAMATFEKAIKEDEKNPVPVAGKGHVKLLQKKTAEGKALLTEAAEMNRKKTAEQWKAIGRAYLSDTKFLLDAISALEKAKALNNGDPEIHLLLGDAYLLQNRGGESVSSYERAASADPKWAKPLFKIAKVYQRSRNNEIVMDYLNRAITVDPEFAPAYKELGETYYLQKKASDAVKAYEKYLSISETPGEAKFQYAFFLIMDKNYEKANTIFKEVLNSKNASPTAYKFYAKSLLEQKKYDEATSVFEKYFQIAKPEEITASDYADYGKLLLEVKQDSLANEMFAKGIKLDTGKQELEIRVLHAETLRKRQKFGAAAEAYKDLIQLKDSLKAPFSADLFWMGWTYYYDTQFPPADSAFTKLTELQPENSLGYLWAAKARQQIDTTGEAGTPAPMYQKYLELTLANPGKIESEKKNIIEAYDYLGTYAVQIKQNAEEALIYFQKILQLDPNNERAKQFMATLKEANTPTRGKGR